MLRPFSRPVASRPLTRPPFRPNLALSPPLTHLIPASRPISTKSIISNFKLVSSEVFSRSGGTFLKRVALLLGLYMVINVLFNAMLLGLSIDYVSKLQKIPSSFQWSSKWKFFQSVITDEVLLKEKEAHREYGDLLERIKREEEKDQDRKEDRQDNKERQDDHRDQKVLILGDEVLKHKPRDFVAGYCDLVLRYALTSEDANALKGIIMRGFDILRNYEWTPGLDSSVTPGLELGNPVVKSQALRMLASLSPEPSTALEYYTELANLIAKKDGIQFEAGQTGILPPNKYISKEMLACLLDLTYFQIDKRLHMAQNLAICTSILRSLQYERAQKLDEASRSKSSALMKQVNKLETESIPMMKSNIAEILWWNKERLKLVKWSQEAVLESLASAHDSYTSARICKNSLVNLAKMYRQLGDEQNAELCSKRAENVNLLIPSGVAGIKMRDVVLDHYFGTWGRILFP